MLSIPKSSNIFKEWITDLARDFKFNILGKKTHTHIVQTLTFKDLDDCNWRSLKIFGEPKSSKPVIFSFVVF